MTVSAEGFKMIPTDFISCEDIGPPVAAKAFQLERPGEGGFIRVSAYPVENAIGTFAVVTGWAEFTEKYFEVIMDLNQRGFNVAMMDWRGQGLSARMLEERAKGYIDSFTTHENDFRNFFDHFVREQFAGPYYLMGHSMGGAISLLLLGNGLKGISAAILSSPMTELFGSKPKRAAVQFMAKLGKNFGLSQHFIPGVKQHSHQFEGNNLTSDPRRHERFRKLQLADPEACVAGPTFSWLNAAFDAMAAINRPGFIEKINTPVLVIAAGNDQTVSTDNTCKLAARSKFIQCEIIEGAYHELLMESDLYRDRFWTIVDHFLQKRADNR